MGGGATAFGIPLLPILAVPASVGVLMRCGLGGWLVISRLKSLRLLVWWIGGLAALLGSITQIEALGNRSSALTSVADVMTFAADSEAALPALTEGRSTAENL